jgi:single-strand DNA-binding protein
MPTITPKAAPCKHLNEVHLAGILARDPELKYTTSGKAVANFTVQTTYEDRNEFHRCTAWEQQAERLKELFRKGSFIKLCGRIQTRNYMKDNRKVYVTEIIVWNFSDGKTEKNGHGVEASHADIPF